MSNSDSPLLSGADNDISLSEDSTHEVKQGLAALTLGAIGVVYGDIGTSPLYAMREALRPVSGDGLERAEVLGVVSILIWTVIMIVTIKYVIFLLRADNHGEGGATDGGAARCPFGGF